jgi:hypothetical protein
MDQMMIFMKKLILPLGIFVAVAFASCDRRATIVEPNKQMANDGTVKSTIAGNWHSVAMASEFEGQSMLLTAISSSMTTGQATLTLSLNGQPDKMETADYTMLDGNKQIVFNKISGNNNMLNGRWRIELTPTTMHMNNDNGIVMKFGK